MIELAGREARTHLLPLFPDARGTLLLSGLQGHMGRVLLADTGRSALVVMFGFVFMGGEPDETLLREAEAYFPQGFLTFSGGEGWLEIAARRGAAGRMTRCAMETPHQFDRETLQRLSVPPAGYEIAAVNSPALFEKCLRAEGDLPDIVRNYPGFSAFSAHALAFCALRDGQIVAGCGTYAHADGWLEVEIDTLPGHRRRGLALCCAANFIRTCEERGLRPHWDAMTEISAALAQKLGFTGARPYSVAYRE